MVVLKLPFSKFQYVLKRKKDIDKQLVVNRI